MIYKIRAGSIYKIPFPFTDLTQVKARPALALTDGDTQGDARFLFITTTPHEGHERAITIDVADYDGPALPLNSYLRFDKTYLLHESLLIKHWARLTDAAMTRIYREIIADEITKFDRFRHTPQYFKPGAVPPSGKVMDAEELVNMVDACLDGWLTADRYNATLENKLSNFIGCKYVRTVNSGSSANLVALASLTSPLLGERALKPGDEVITVAAGFPTTINPILLYGLIPVFVDVTLPTYNIDATQIKAAITPKTRAIMLAHTMGNPFNLDAVMALVKEHNLWLIEDCCDALGATYTGCLPPLQGEGGDGGRGEGEIPRHVGTFGHIGTLSFYPAHQITMGEGGAVFTNDATLVRAMESIRDWGRDCWCAPGSDATCKKRYSRKLGDLPEGYDHKYIYSHLGFNLKITDIQAACAVAQMDKLPGFVETRRQNFETLRNALLPLEEFLILPEATPNSSPSWFGMLLTLRQEIPNASRPDLLRYLDSKNIGTRLLFAGNVTKQPYFAGRTYRTVGELPQTDLILHHTFWVGLWPGLTSTHLDFIAQTLHDYFLKDAR
ncbi:MAG: lipopolysaccharide biosynthesis protein RfbH [Rhodocyclaceae bacterium]|nr:lipopolysaccharide biosynthesis protein RfbH [Rhodocyclaceae bacterium]